MMETTDEVIEQSRSHILNRRGTFDIARELVESNPELLMEHIFSKIVVLRCEFCYSKNAFEYHACSNEFDEVPEGEEIPRYFVEFTRDEDNAVSARFFADNTVRKEIL